MAGAPKDGVGPFPWVRPDFFAEAPQVLNAQEFVAAWYGVQVRTINRRQDITVSTAPIRIDTYPRQRAKAIWSNTGSGNVVIDANPQITYPNGIFLLPGMAVILDVREDWQLLQDEWWAISTGGGTTIHALEVVFAGA
jgi:hypothetical protein